MTDPPRRERLRRLSAAAIGLLISAGFVHLLLAKLDLATVWTEIRRVDLWVLSLCLVTSLTGFLAVAGRSAILLRPLADYRFYRVFKSVLVGFAGNNVLPLRAGELLRIDYLARHGPAPHSACLAVVGTERLLDVVWIALVFLGLMAVATDLPVATSPIVPGALALGLFALLVVASRRPRLLVGLARRLTAWLGERVSAWITARAESFAHGLSSLRSSGRAAAAFLVSGGYWASALAGTWIGLRALGIEAPWYAPAVVLVFIAFGVALPSTPAFIGTYHYFAAAALTVLGVAPEPAASYAIVQHAVSILPYTAFSLVLLGGDLFRGRRGEELAAEGEKTGVRRHNSPSNGKKREL